MAFGRNKSTRISKRAVPRAVGKRSAGSKPRLPDIESVIELQLKKLQREQGRYIFSASVNYLRKNGIKFNRATSIYFLQMISASVSSNIEPKHFAPVRTLGRRVSTTGYSNIRIERRLRFQLNRNIEVFGAAIVRNSGESRVVDPEVIARSLKDICPLWPFC